jgi:hypothetical protein
VPQAECFSRPVSGRKSETEIGRALDSIELALRSDSKKDYRAFGEALQATKFLRRLHAVLDVEIERLLKNRRECLNLMKRFESECRGR